MIDYSAFILLNPDEYAAKKIIPKYLYKTAHFDIDKIPEELQLVLEKNCIKSSDYTTVYFNDNDCNNFIEKYFPEYFDDYDNLIPGAYRADVFKLLILYQFGGVFSNMAQQYITNINDIIRENDELVLVKDWHGSGNGIFNAFMACYPRHPIILEMIKYIMDNIAKWRYNNGHLDVTGPQALAKAFNLFFKNELGKNIDTGIYTIDGYLIKMYDCNIFGGDGLNQSFIVDTVENKKIIKIRFQNYYNLMYDKNHIHYNELYKKRMVYKNHNMNNRIITYNDFIPPNTDQYNTTKTIPKYIYKTSRIDLDKFPQELRDILESNISNSPCYTTVYFNDTDCNNFIEKYFPEYFDDYDNLIPGAYRADVFRLLILYKFGGVYSDMAQQFITNMNDIIRENDELVLVKDWHGSGNGIFNAFMACCPQHPIIMGMIKYIMDNIAKRRYNNGPLDVTGPQSLAKAFNLFFGNDLGNKIDTGIYTIDGYLIKMYDCNIFGGDGLNQSFIVDTVDKKMIKIRFQNYYNLMYDKKNIHYSELHKKRMVYKNHSIKKNKDNKSKSVYIDHMNKYV